MFKNSSAGWLELKFFQPWVNYDNVLVNGSPVNFCSACGKGMHSWAQRGPLCRFTMLFLHIALSSLVLCLHISAAACSSNSNLCLLNWVISCVLLGFLIPTLWFRRHRQKVNAIVGLTSLFSLFQELIVLLSMLTNVCKQLIYTFPFPICNIQSGSTFFTPPNFKKHPESWLLVWFGKMI